MKRLLTALTFVAALAAVPSTAIAGPIVIDPIIGVRGIDSGSTASNNSDFVTMGGCQADLIAFFGEGNVFCESFYIVNPVPPPFSEGPPTFYVSDVTLRFADASGGIINTALFGDSESGLNEFPDFTREEDGFAVTLAMDDDSLSCGINSPSSESHTSCFQVYLAIPLNETVNGPYKVSLTAINGIQQDTTLAPVPTPEPGTLVLMGIGLAGAAGRRLRRKSA